MGLSQSMSLGGTMGFCLLDCNLTNGLCLPNGSCTLDFCLIDGLGSLGLILAHSNVNIPHHLSLAGVQGWP